VNYSDIIQALDEASAFDLYRLRTALDNMIDDPKRLIEVKKALRLGMEIEYYDAAANRVEPAIVEKIMLSLEIFATVNAGRYLYARSMSEVAIPILLWLTIQD